MIDFPDDVKAQLDSMTLSDLTPESYKAMAAGEETPKPVADAAPDAPAAESAPDAQPVPQAPEPEPFEGFNALPPEAQDKFRAAISARDHEFQEREQRLRNDLQAAVGRIGPEQQARARLERERADLQQKLERAKTPAQAAAVEKKLALNLDKWHQYREANKDEAEIFEQPLVAMANVYDQRLAETRAEFERKLAELNNRFADVDSVKQSWEYTQKENERIATLSAIESQHPNFRLLAGWIDDDGNAIPKEQQQGLHPELQDWLNYQPPSIKAQYDSQLSSMDPVLVSHVLNQFNRDYRDRLLASAPPEAQHAAPTAAAQRRAAALKDPSPRPGQSALGGGAASNEPALDPRFLEAWHA